MYYQARPIMSLYLLEVIVHQLDCFGEVHKVEIKALEPSCLNVNRGSTILTLDKLLGLSMRCFPPCVKIKIITYFTSYLLRQEGQLMQRLDNLINSSLSPLSHPIIVARWQLLLTTRNRKGDFPSCAFSFSLKFLPETSQQI